MLDEKELYIGCLNKKDIVRKEFFDRYFSVMHTICLRYADSVENADDLLQEGFIKVFQNIEKFSWKGTGSFVSWVKTIFINLAINEYRKKSRLQISRIDDSENELYDSDSENDDDSIIELALDIFTHNDIVKYISELPHNFRIVFNLFALEGMKHKEIAQLLNISIKTSTTRYLRAKSKLKVILTKELHKQLNFVE